MPHKKPFEHLADPFSEVTRKERKNLLLVSLIGIAVSEMGLVPTKIQALGLEFPLAARQSFVILFAFVVVYFLLTFVIYGVADFVVWRKQYQEYLELSQLEAESWTEEQQRSYDDLHQHIPKALWLYPLSKYVTYVRVVFEFILPVLLGLASILRLAGFIPHA